MRRRAPVRLGLGLALLLCAIAGNAWGQEAPPEAAAEQARVASLADADKAVAKSLVDEGDKQFAQGAYADAVERYRGAHALVQVPTTGWELARALEAGRRLREAEQVLAWVAAYPTWDGQPEPFSTTRDKARAKLKVLRARIPQLSVAVTNPDPQMALTIDGMAAQTGVPIQLDPGAHVVELVAPGATRVQREVDLAEGAKRTVVLTLETGSSPGVPSAGVMPSPGVAMPFPGYATPASQPEIPAWTWIGVGVAGVGAVVGGVTGGLSLSRASAFKSTQLPNGNYPESERGVRDESMTLAHVATASFAVAGVGAAVAVTGLILTYAIDDGPSEPALAVGVGPGHLSFGGTF